MVAGLTSQVVGPVDGWRRGWRAVVRACTDDNVAVGLFLVAYCIRTGRFVLEKKRCSRRCGFDRRFLDAKGAGTSFLPVPAIYNYTAMFWCTAVCAGVRAARRVACHGGVRRAGTAWCVCCTVSSEGVVALEVKYMPTPLKFGGAYHGAQLVGADGEFFVIW